MKRIITLLCLTLLPMSAFAVPAGDFLERCKTAAAKPETAEDNKLIAQRLITAGSCVGFVGGTLAGINLISNMMLQQKVVKANLVCLPKDTTPQQVYNDTLSYIDKEEDVKKMPIEAAIFRLFTQKYPCASEEKK